MYDGQIERENKPHTAFAPKFNSGKNEWADPIWFTPSIIQASAGRICDDKDWNMVKSYKQWKWPQLFTAWNVE